MGPAEPRTSTELAEPIRPVEPSRLPQLTEAPADTNATRAHRLMLDLAAPSLQSDARYPRATRRALRSVSRGTSPTTARCSRTEKRVFPVQIASIKIVKKRKTAWANHICVNKAKKTPAVTAVGIHKNSAPVSGAKFSDWGIGAPLDAPDVGEVPASGLGFRHPSAASPLRSVATSPPFGGVLR